MVGFAIGLFFLGWISPALAQAPPPPVPIELLCRQLVAYQPEPGVEYRPGMDARGRRVAPADDENTVQMPLPDMTYVSVTMDQAAQLGLPPQNGFTPYAYVGEVMVNKYGDVYFNNKRISHTQMQALCGEKPVEPFNMPGRRSPR